MRIDGKPLAPEAIAVVARGGVELEVASWVHAQASARYAREVAAQRPLYGRSTGVGANRDVTLDDPEAFAVGLLRSHATSAGPLRSPQRVRAMLAVRLNQLAVGGSGADPALLAALAAMITADALPQVREHGSIGTGDLAPLAATALALAGEGPRSSPTLAGEPNQRFSFGPHDALAFISSNAAAIGDAALAQAELAVLSRSAIGVAAVTFTAIRGNAEAFAPVVEAVTPFAGARAVCRAVRSLVDPEEPASRIQDPFGLRTLPQVHGAYLDALDRLGEVTAAMSAAPSENPVLDPRRGVAHHGGFHAAYLAQALDAVRSAAAQSAQLSVGRLALLCEPSFTGLAPFLAVGPAGASGVMLTEYVASSALVTLHSLGAPAGLGTAVLSRGVEQDASFASLAARQGLDCPPAYRTVLACELVAGLRALRQQGRTVPAALAASLSTLPGDDSDRDLSDDLALASDLLDDLADAVPIP